MARRRWKVPRKMRASGRVREKGKERYSRVGNSQLLSSHRLPLHGTKDRASIRHLLEFTIISLFTTRSKIQIFSPVDDKIPQDVPREIAQGASIKIAAFNERSKQSEKHWRAICAGHKPTDSAACSSFYFPRRVTGDGNNNGIRRFSRPTGLESSRPCPPLYPASTRTDHYQCDPRCFSFDERALQDYCALRPVITHMGQLERHGESLRPVVSARSVLLLLI